MERRFFIAIALLALVTPVGAQTLHVYGPGGPAPAMKEAAAAFGKKTGTKVMIVAGPTSQWIDHAKQDADVIYSGAENMMTDFVKAMDGQIDEKSIDPLYLRVSSILVRPGNPKRIGGLRDLVRPGRRIIVVQGSGQAGLWEDMAGRTGKIDMVRAVRRNIVGYAATSAEAKAMWLSDPTIDSWIIWGIWEKANPAIADTVAVEPEYRIYRDAGTALTRRGKEKAASANFLAFLRSRTGAGIFARWGWIVKK